MRVRVLSVLCLAACSGPLVTHPDLPGQAATEIVCSPLPLAEAKARLQKAWTKCYVGPELKETVVPVGGARIVVPLASSGTTRVTDEGAPDGGALNVLLPGGKWGLHAVFLHSASCPSLIKIDSGPGLWVSAARNTETWLADPDAPGPLAACK